ncbi:MAG: tRNA threonylcarbamoyladenosine dehydratase, partial [Proteobacteria bacterium]|nr:tRNA threonylcarbamoyladenosine dehydratase [Pseudomonadota bacterium]
SARVVVVGYGAVGGFAVEALVRSGVGHIRIMDADCFEASNVNRQIGALASTLGCRKVEAGRERLLAINPVLDVEAVNIFVDETSYGRVTGAFSDGVLPDLVIDAIDTLEAKAGLLAHCVRAGVPVLSSMGAARKRDMSAIRVGDISKTAVCPLARCLRKRLRALGVERGVRCVYSVEEAAEETHFSRCHGEEPPAGSIQRPALGSLVTVTGAFGLRLASEAIAHLTAGAGTNS